MVTQNYPLFSYAKRPAVEGDILAFSWSLLDLRDATPTEGESIEDVLRRLIRTVPVLFGVTLVVLAMAWVTAGDPVAALMGESAQGIHVRGRLDGFLMRAMDVLLAFPSLLLAPAVTGTLGPGLFNAVIAIAIVDVPQYARLVRSVALGAREEEYVQAARALGANDGRLMLRHVLPNAIGPIVVQATLGVGFAILAIAGLSFLGLGV